MAFSNKVVVITGAASGFGVNIAKAFGKEKANLVLTGRNKDNLSKVAEECTAVGASQVVQVIAELSNLPEVKNIIEESVNAFGKIDILINNAGRGVLGGVEDSPIDRFDEVFQVSLRAPFYLAQLAVPHLEKTNGNIINISGMISKYPAVFAATASMAKASMDHFTKISALEFASKGVRVNSVNPCFMQHDKEIVPGFFEMLKREAKKQPLGEVNVTHQEVIDSIMFLASDKAKALTGINCSVDRGRTLIGH